MKRLTENEWAEVSQAVQTTTEGGAVLRLLYEAERARASEETAALWFDLVREAHQTLEALELERTTDGDDVSFDWEQLNRLKQLLPRLREALGRVPKENQP